MGNYVMIFNVLLSVTLKTCWHHCTTFYISFSCKEWWVLTSFSLMGPSSFVLKFSAFFFKKKQSTFCINEVLFPIVGILYWAMIRHGSQLTINNCLQISIQKPNDVCWEDLSGSRSNTPLQTTHDPRSLLILLDQHH